VKKRVTTAAPAFCLLQRRQLLWLAEQAAGAARLGAPSLVVGHDPKISADAVLETQRDWTVRTRALSHFNEAAIALAQRTQTHLERAAAVPTTSKNADERTRTSGLAAGVAMANMMTGEVIFGGPGSGLYGMLLLVVLGVFLAGLMVGRTPEYLGKQIQDREVKLASLGTLFVPLLVLVSAAIAIRHIGGTPVDVRQRATGDGRDGLRLPLPGTQNNGAAFAGYSGFIQPLAGNVGSHGITFADLAGGIIMIFGRFVPILAALALAGSLGPRRIAPFGLGTLRTDTPTFVIFLVAFVLIFAVLTFLSVLVLAPFAQALSSQLLG